jgi:hypothetical protein
MKILVKTSVNSHHRSACAMSIHFFSGEESESADRIALRSTVKGREGVDVSGCRLLLLVASGSRCSAEGGVIARRSTGAYGHRNANFNPSVSELVN